MCKKNSGTFLTIFYPSQDPSQEINILKNFSQDCFFIFSLAKIAELILIFVQLELVDNFLILHLKNNVF
ncbi:hypothetical protein B6N58_02820 [Legionella micdadei]|nr:hypothetical protein B6N58_02820 [Legionella micdadei]ARG99436.1 hypothetical protein B6V88_02810 [Legionella micdadei]